MENKGKYKQYKFENDLDRGSDPDFDLDEYIRQQSMGQSQSADLHTPVDEETSQFKNAILMFLVFAAAFLWANDWSPTQAWGSIFGSNDADVTATAPSAPAFELPDIPNVSEVPSIPGVGNETGYVNYLIEINESGFSDIFSSSALQAFYQSDVPTSYLSELVEAGYQELSYPAIIAYYNSDVSLEYLNSLNEYGFLSEFSYPEVIAYYNSDVSIDYLNTLNEAGYLENLSYPAVIAYFNSGVTIEFLDRLRDNSLLDNMSYPEVVSAFNTDN
jgi:hypothetical protein